MSRLLISPERSGCRSKEKTHRQALPAVGWKLLLLF
jgi:hypothetical protein